MQKSYKSNGKLLLTGEYVVLDGALALAIPTAQGQSLELTPLTTPELHWYSYDVAKQLWFQDQLHLDVLEHTVLETISPSTPSLRLLQILVAARRLNPEFLNTDYGFKIETYLDFPRQWGLGTSSTLINNVAQWAGVNPYALLKLTFGGSGYDIACAQHDSPICYNITDDSPSVSPVQFSPAYSDQLYFVYLNEKQNSREGIAHYKALKGDLGRALSEVSAITEAVLQCTTLSAFQDLIKGHEHLIAALTQQEQVGTRLFKDFNGAVKSLGAWGGDFILAASETNPTAYFKAKGFDTVVPYHQMIL